MEPSRRDRNMQAKRERIFAAAAELFAERSVDQVTTQQVADRADVAIGTLFRYAATKGELIMMVQNETWSRAVDAGIAAAQHHTTPSDALAALAAPTIELALEQPENVAAYQRELMFGSQSDQHRAEGLAVMTTLITAAARILSPADPDAATVAAQAAFAVIHMGAVRATHEPEKMHEVVRLQLHQLAAGYAVTSADATQ